MRLDKLGAARSVLETNDLHIHLPAGAIPKDGPSAGVAMFLAVASLLSGRTVRNDIAMTGEISLRGLVLPIGGIKEKALAALRAGIDTVLLPKRNEKDLEDIPEPARKQLKFVFLENIDDALAAAFDPPPGASESDRRASRLKAASRDQPRSVRMRAHRPELRPCHHVPAARGLRSTTSRATSSRRSSGGSCAAGSSVTARPSATAAIQSGAELVSFSCNDYLGLSQHPEVVAASLDATRRFGVGRGLLAARQRQPSALRRARAQARGAQGHRGRRRLRQRLSDERRRDPGARRPQRSDPARRALPQLAADGRELSGARVLEFRHNDVAHCRSCSRAERAAHRHCLVLTDGVFSMEGDLAPLAAARRARGRARRVAHDRRRARPRRRRRRPRLELRFRRSPSPSRCKWGRCRKPSAATAATSARAAASPSSSAIAPAASSTRRACRPAPSRRRAARSTSSRRTRSSCAGRSRARASSRQRSALPPAHERDRLAAHGRRRARARGERGAARRGLPRRGDPPADGAARHVAAARDVLGRAYRGAGRGARGRRAAFASRMTRRLRHVVGNGHRQNLRDAAAHRRAQGRGPARAGAETHRVGLRCRASRRQRHARCCCARRGSTVDAGEPRRREPVAFRGAVVARYGCGARASLDSVRRARRALPRRERAATT